MKKGILAAALLCCTLLSGTAYASDYYGWDTILLAPQSQNSPNYNIYHNSRFNFSIPFPNYFGQSGELPGNGDGICMEGEGATLAMSGSHNMGDTPESDFEYVYDKSSVFGKETTADTLSYYQDEGSTEMYYYKKFGSICCSFAFEYPKDEHDKYAEIISYMKQNMSLG